MAPRPTAGVWTRWTLGVVIAGLACLASCESLRPTVPRGVILILIDTLRADRLGCYGYGRPTSPAIDRLAAEGLVFEDAWSPSPPSWLESGAQGTVRPTGYCAKDL